MATPQTSVITEAGLQFYQKPLTAIEIRAQVNLIQEVMQAVMKKDTHYGTIPGCAKPSLYKPGAEILFTTFHVFVDPIVEDLGHNDLARFRVTAYAKSAVGVSLGSAIGEASSEEEKYKWREMVCSDEYDETPEDRKRKKWKKGRTDAYAVFQVHTNVADVQNTVLKMAYKRAFVALALQITAASDIFTQDIQDLPPEVRNEIVGEESQSVQGEVLPAEIKRKDTVPVQGSPEVAHRSELRPIQAATPRPPVQSPKPVTTHTISEPQSRRFYAIYKQAGRTNEEVKAKLQEVCGITDSRQIPADPKTIYEGLCTWAQTGEAF